MKLYPYKVTIEFLANGWKDKVVETFDVSTAVEVKFGKVAKLSSPITEDFHMGKPLFWTKQSVDQDVMNGPFIRGKVCFCTFVDQANLKHFIVEVSKVGVAAVFVGTKPDFESSVPVLCLPQDIVRKLDGCTVVVVVIQALEVGVGAAQTAENMRQNAMAPKELQHPVSDYSRVDKKVATSPKEIGRKTTLVTESSSASEDPSMEDEFTDGPSSTGKSIDKHLGNTCVGIISENSCGGETYSDVPNSASEGAESGKRHESECYSKGKDPKNSERSVSIGGKLLSYVTAVVSSVMNGMVPKSEISELLSKKVGWDPTSEFQGYKDAIFFVHRCRLTYDIVQEVVEWMEGNSVTLLRLVVCMEIWMSAERGPKMAKMALFHAIMGCTGALRRKTKSWRSLKNLHSHFEPREKPHLIAGKFFKTMIRTLLDRMDGESRYGLLQKEPAFVEFWVSVFWLWDDSGLLAPRKIEWCDWDIILKLVDRDFACKHSEAMLSVMDINRVRTFSIFLQRNAGYLHSCVKKDVSKGKETITLEPPVADLLINLCEEMAKKTLGRYQPEVQDWTKVFEVISMLPSKAPFCHPELIRKIVGLASFKTCSSLALYPVLVEQSKETVLEEMTWSEVVRGLENDLLQTRKFNFHSSLVALLNLPTGCRLLKEEVLFDRVVSYVKKATPDASVAFADKLTLISAIHCHISKHKRQEDCLMDSLLAVACLAHSTRQKLLESSMWACEARLPCQELLGFGEGAAQWIIDSLTLGDMIENLPTIKQVTVRLLQNAKDGIFRFHSFRFHLSLKLRYALITACSSIDRAAAVLEGLGFGQASDDDLFAFVECIYAESFNVWMPTSLGMIAGLDRNADRFLLRCLGEERSTRMTRHLTDCLASIFSGWLSSYKNASVDLESLTKGMVCSKLEIWAAMDCLQLPSTKTIEATIDEWQSLTASIKTSMAVPLHWQYSLSDVLGVYNCHENEKSDFGRIVAVHKLLDSGKDLKLETTMDFQPNGTSKSDDLSLLQMRTDASSSASLRSTFWPALSICEHFLQNKSYIFDSVVRSFLDKDVDLVELKRSVECATNCIKSHFIADCKFADIASILSTCPSQPGALEAECKALHTPLELTTVEIDRFLLAASMRKIEVPLLDFLRCCEQFKFSVAQDKDFLQLKDMYATLLSSAESTVATICGLCQGFLYLLRPFVAWDEYSAQDLRLEMQQYEGLFNLLGKIGFHSEVWIFACDMKWFGKDGLERFYNEHENVTNVLLGNTSESYYMSVLDALEPTIRVVSAVGALQTEQRLLHLLDDIMKNSDIQKWQTGGSNGNLEQVQSNLSLLRRWFSDGVDEIAGLHSILNAVKTTGKYVVLSSGGSTLGLEYRIDSHGTEETKRLIGKELLSFIEQVGMIQHEGPGKSLGVEGFVEQHQIVQKAFCNFLESSSVGYGLDELHSFSCPAGGTHQNEANELLKNSLRCLNTTNAWVASIRRRFPASLLFWIDELKEIHSLMTCNPSDAVIQALSAKLLRLNNLASFSILSNTISKFMQDANFHHTLNWFDNASAFLETVRHEMGPLPLQQVDGRGSVILHTLSCIPGYENDAVLVVLQDIYQDRLPQSFELLDALTPHSGGKLDLFLQRVRTFTTSTFTIVNVEELLGKDQEKVLDFVCERENQLNGVQLHCIQTKSSILHSSAFVEGKTWDYNLLASQPIRWKSHIAGGEHIKEVSIVVSNSCGAGKTRFIRKQIQELCHSGDKFEFGCLTVHEGSTADTLANEILSFFSEGESQKALHISFMCMPLSPQSHDTKKWLQSINFFFFSLLVHGVLRSDLCSRSFHIGKGAWTLYVEFPSSNNLSQPASESTLEWLRQYIPVLALCGHIVLPPEEMSIDSKTRRVCTYLRAYENGTIDRTFQKGSSSKRILFVFDRSSSMTAHVGNGKTALGAATDCALQIFESHLQINDTVAIILFNHEVEQWAPIETIVHEDQKTAIGKRLDDVRNQARGGTVMYPALQEAVEAAERFQDGVETWILCLTDGATSGNDQTFRPCLEKSSENLHIIVIGVNLRAQYEAHLRLLCNKYHGGPTATKGFFISSQANLASMQNAFQTAAKSIPVSQTFELDGQVSNSECCRLIRKYAPDSIANANMQMLTFWVRFLYRRVSVLDANKDFNYNEEFENLGSTLMEIMLFEVARLVGNEFNHDWINNNYTQLIYDFEKPNSPEFRLLCTSPSQLDPAAKQRYETLALPGLSVPTDAQLKDKRVLCQYLSQALDIPLTGQECLDCINMNKFVLTLDFTIKMLNIHERVASGIPSIIEGETGVSKTALTKMYSILQNLSIAASAEASTKKDLASLVQELQSIGYQLGVGDCPLTRLEGALRAAEATSREESSSFASQLYALITAKCERRSAIFIGIPTEFSNKRTDTVMGMLRWFAASQLEPIFFDINVDASMTEADILALLRPVRDTATKLQCLGSKVVVFFDEINTSSVLGLFKEIVVDHSLNGVPLEDNIVAVAACNPARVATFANSKLSRVRDLGTCWASGHYQVMALPPSMEQLKWSFGSLREAQEKEFVSSRLEMIGPELIPPALRLELTNVICASQAAIRRIAERHLNETFAINRKDAAIVDDVHQRAASVVSLRDIQRVFSLFNFFAHEFDSACLCDSTASHSRKAMLLAVAVVYYMRLDAHGRDEFLHCLKSPPGGRQEKADLQQVLEKTMKAVIAATHIPNGIAVTRGLTENLFMTLVCLLSRTPLMIVGPPGSSKTLSVNMLGDNANGEDSPNPFYRHFARLSLFHYQCSKESNSREIASVFEKARQRQEKGDASKQRCCVFMDEAGLPEEERESLKVLHYLLEGHMQMKTPVGFVAITNHILDAAKSNRCAVLLRPEPDAEEMLTIATGLLFNKDTGGNQITREVDLGGQVLTADEFAARLCQCYSGLIHGGINLKDLETFFGLRDFIYFLKALKSSSSLPSITKMGISLLSFVQAIERNFNGLTAESLNEIIVFFLSHFSALPKVDLQMKTAKLTRGPIDVIAEALKFNKASSNLESRARFKLIIDCSEDDSIMRILHHIGLLDVSKNSLFKLSHMAEDFASEKLRLISGVKYAAAQGNIALLSETDPVNESFYDLFNQHFRAVIRRDGDVALFANIAVGGVSRRSLVRPEFGCIVHVRESQLHELPAPFLNRFEKYRLDVSDVMREGWSRLGALLCILQRARFQTEVLLDPLLREQGLFGLVNPKQTLDSVFVGLLPAWAVAINGEGMPSFSVETSVPFLETMSKFLLVVMSLNIDAEELEAVLRSCNLSLPKDQQEVLQQLTCRGAGPYGEELQGVIDGLSSNPCSSSLGKLCQSVIQMALTKRAVSSLLQLATPEAVYVNQRVLQKEILEGFLYKGQSSLKQIIEAELPQLKRSPVRLILAYTRTDAFNHCIPTLAPNQDELVLGSKTVDKIKSLVCDDLHEVIIERLEALHSEAKLRSSITIWAQHTNKRVFVLLVDMNESQAIERCNYVRMCAEQYVHGLTNKLLLLLLHYHPSTSLKSDRYPALLLGGWRHVFLDGVGQLGPDLGINQWLRIACKEEAEEDSEIANMLVDFLHSLLPNTLSHIACQRIFHPLQLAKMEIAGGDLYSMQLAALKALSLRKVGQRTIGRILCQQYALEWRKHTLPKVAQSSSRGLLERTTQLSMGASIQNTFVKSFEAFVMLSFLEMNKAQNLDVLYKKTGRKCIEDFFGNILESIPVIPLEEMLVHHEHVHGRLPVSIVTSVRASFPFFAMVSTCIEKCLEEVERKMVSNPKQTYLLKGDVHNHKQLFSLAMELVDATTTSDDTPIQPRATHRSKAFLKAIKLVDEGSRETRAFLFSLYLNQFVEHRTGCRSNKFVADWLERGVAKIGGQWSILGIHCVERYQKIDFTRLVSWALTLKEQLPVVWENIINGIDFDQSHQNLFVHTLFSRLMVYLQGKLPESLYAPLEWTNLLSSFLGQLGSGQLTADFVQTENTQDCLRVLVVFHVLGSIPGSELVRRAAFQKWYNEEQQAIKVQEKGNVSLNDILALVCESKRAKESILRQFFSCTTMKLFPSYLSADLNCLLDLIESGTFLGRNPQYVTAVLQKACSWTDDEGSLDIMASEALDVLNAKLRCRRLPIFTSDGSLTCLPHFIPSWLRTEVQTRDSPRSQLYPAFFCSYQHSFEGKLPSVVFDMLLGIMLQQACTLSSLDLLQMLANDIEAELDVKASSFGYDRLEAGRMPLAGSGLGALMVDARVVCFVAKVAKELAMTASAVALSGLEGELGSMILEQIMCLPGVCFKEFFFSLIIHHSGEGTLAEMLLPGGALHLFSWCESLSKGVPALRGSYLSALKAAEAAFSEGLKHEEAKASAFRLCPKCGAPFEVDRVACGTFTCGQDTDGIRGKPSVGGQAVKQIYGCGTKFRLDTAGKYTVDKKFLKPLSNEVNKTKVAFLDFECSESRWSAVLAFELPTLLFTVQEEAGGTVVPAATIMTRAKLSEVQKCHLQIIVDGTNFRSELYGLPDLIEFYLWLNDTFRYLITKEQAISTPLRNLMNKQQLLKRFDRVHVSHLLSLWTRVSCYMNKLLKDPQGKVFWNCEEVVCTFQSFEEAPLIALLSEGSCPEDGNDFLFLVINGIVNKYNRYVERFSELQELEPPIAADQKKVIIIHPKTILPGSAGSIQINLLPLLPTSDVDALAMATWDCRTQNFEVELLDSLLTEAVFHKATPPLISSPLTFLREQFIFRDDQQIDGVLQSGGLAFATPSGIFYAREQDFKVARRAQNLLERFGISKRDKSISGPLRVNFQCMDSHQDVSSLLDSFCNLLDRLWSEGHTKFLGMAETIQSVYQQSLEELLTNMGSPNLRSSQLRLIGSLKGEQVAELVHYLSYQLAVEGYLYAKFDLCVTDPMNQNQESMIRSNITNICAKQGAEHTLAAVSSFVDDILDHYKKEICKKALQQASLLCPFLVDMNAVDSYDAILTCLPFEITVRHYVSLLQLFRQIKLFLLLKISKARNVQGQREYDGGCYAQGKCWLWEGDTSLAVHSTNLNEVEEKENDLWFASAESVQTTVAVTSMEGILDNADSLAVEQADDPNKEEDGMEREDWSDKEMDLETHQKKPETTSDNKQLSALLIQRWWRAQLVNGECFVDAVEDWGNEVSDADLLVKSGSTNWKVDAGDTVDDDNSRMSKFSAMRQGETSAAADLHSAPRPSSLMVGMEADDASNLFEWSNQVGLSGTASKQLVELGARNLEDIRRVVGTFALLSALPRLDQQKLRAAVGSQELKGWLAEHALNLGTEEQLREVGATTIQDVRIMIMECEDKLEGLSKLDRYKLKRAFKD